MTNAIQRFPVTKEDAVLTNKLLDGVFLRNQSEVTAAIISKLNRIQSNSDLDLETIKKELLAIRKAVAEQLQNVTDLSTAVELSTDDILENKQSIEDLSENVEKNTSKIVKLDKAISEVATKLNDFLYGSDTDGIINKWKELEKFLKDQTELDTLAELLEVKADVDDVYSKDVIDDKHIELQRNMQQINNSLSNNQKAVELLKTDVINNKDNINSNADAIEECRDDILKLDQTKADKAKTLAGYGIEDAYTKEDVDKSINEINSSLDNVDDTFGEINVALDKVNQSIEDIVDLIDSIESGSPFWDNILGKPEFSDVAFSGDYFDIINTPGLVDFVGVQSIGGDKAFVYWTGLNFKAVTLGDNAFSNFTKLSQLENDLQLDTIYVKIGDSVEVAEFASTAEKDGDGNVISETYATNNVVGLIEDRVDALENDTVLWEEILDKPSFANVAFSGDYNDLINKPTIPDSGTGDTPDLDEVLEWFTLDRETETLTTKWNLASNKTVSSLGVGKDDSGEIIVGAQALYELNDVASNGDNVAGAVEGNALVFTNGKWQGGNVKVDLSDIELSIRNHESRISTNESDIEDLKNAAKYFTLKQDENGNYYLHTTYSLASDETVSSLGVGDNNDTEGIGVSILQSWDDDSDTYEVMALGSNLGRELYADISVVKNENLNGISSRVEAVESGLDSANRTLTIHNTNIQSNSQSIAGINERITPIEQAFNEIKTWFTLEGDVLRTTHSLASDKTVSSLGVGSDGTGGVSYDRLDSWDSYTDDKAGYVLSAFLGWDLKTRLDNLDLGSGYLTKEEASGTYATITDLSTLSGVVSGKQDAISDLATIREGAALGATAYGWGNHADKGYAKQDALNNLGDAFDLYKSSTNQRLDAHDTAIQTNATNIGKNQTAIKANADAIAEINKWFTLEDGVLHSVYAIASDSTMSSLGVGSDEDGGVGGVIDLTKVATDILPAANDTYNIGSLDSFWAAIYVNDVNASVITEGGLRVATKDWVEDNYVLNSALANYVTKDGWQSITGKKSFEGGIDVYGQLNGYLSDGEYRSWYIDHEGNGAFTSLKVGSYDVLHKGNTSYSPVLTSGTKIGTITIGGTATDLYAPVGGGDTSELEMQVSENSQLIAELTTDFNNLNENKQDKITATNKLAYSLISGTPTLGDAASKGVTTSVTNGSTDLVTSGAVYTSINSLGSSISGLNGEISAMKTLVNDHQGKWQSFTSSTGLASGYIKQLKADTLDLGGSVVATTDDLDAFGNTIDKLFARKATTLAGYGITDGVPMPSKNLYYYDLNTLLTGDNPAAVVPYFQRVGVNSNVNNIGTARKGVIRLYGGGSESQLVFDHYTGTIYFRHYGESTFSDWKTILDSSNFSSYALPLSGGDINGYIRAYNYRFINNSGTYLGLLTADGNDENVLYFATRSGTFHALIHTGNIGSYALTTSGGQMDRNAGITWNNGYYDSDAVGSHLSVLADTTQDNSLATQTYRYQVVLNVGGGGIDTYRFQIASYAGGNNLLYYRGYNGNNKTWDDWRKIIHSGNIGNQSVSYATSAGNASSATKLATARTIWGQSFDGSGNISYSMSPHLRNMFFSDGTGDVGYVGKESASNEHIGLVNLKAGDVFLRTSGKESTNITLKSNGNVLIGTTTDSGQKLQVYGNGYIGTDAEGIWVSKSGNTIDATSKAGDSLPLYLNHSSSGDVRLAVGGGNVQIGTYTSTSYKLFVVGNANFTDGVITDRVHIAQSSDIARGIATSYTDTSNDSNGIARPWYGLSFVSGSTYEQTYLSGYFGMTFRTGGTPYYFVYQGGGIRPWSNGTQNCGTTGFAWANVVAVNGIYSGSLSAGSLTVSGGILPSTTDTQSLGSTSSYWKNLYVGIITGHYQSGDVVKFSGSINANEGNISCKSLTVNGSSLSTLITEALNTFDEENLGTAASYGVTTSVTSGSSDLVTSGGVASALSGYVGKGGGAITGTLSIGSTRLNVGSTTLHGDVSLEYGALTITHGTIGSSYWSITNDGVATVKTLSQTSDERMKNILNGDFRLSLATMACAPLVIFDWNNSSNSKHNVGTIAQYWQGALPEVVTKTMNGTLALSYGELGVAMGISLANILEDTNGRVATVEEEIKALKEENKRLKERVAELEAA